LSFRLSPLRISTFFPLDYEYFPHVPTESCPPPPFFPCRILNPFFPFHSNRRGPPSFCSHCSCLFSVLRGFESCPFFPSWLRNTSSSFSPNDKGASPRSPGLRPALFPFFFASVVLAVLFFFPVETKTTPLPLVSGIVCLRHYVILPLFPGPKHWPLLFFPLPMLSSFLYSAPFFCHSITSPSFRPRRFA